jgi:hypothetical protein
MNDNIITEAALTDSVLYKSFNNNAELTTTLVAAMKNAIIIDSSYIQEQLMQIQRTRISPLSDKVLQAYEDGDIILMYAKVKKVPDALPFFITKLQGKIKAVIFVNNRGTISASSLNSEEKYLNITMKDLYVLMEGSYTALQYAIHPDKFQRSLGLMKVCSSLYTSMVLRILMREYSIANDQELYNKVCFAIGKFFLNNVWMSTNEDVVFTYAKNCINTNGGVNVAPLVQVNDEMNDRGITTIVDLLAYFKELSPRFKGLNFRYFTQCYINLYKAPAMFSMECLPYFLFTVEASMIGSFIVNQPMVYDVAKTTKGMNTFYPELAKLV